MKAITPPDYRILEDEKQNNFLIKNGYCTAQILNEEEIDFFKSLYKKWHTASPDAFYKSYFSSNPEYVREVEEAIMQYCVPKIDKLFTNYEPFGGMFVVKPTGDKGHIPPHQDWSFVDEKIHWSLNMWLPIQDTNERNGTLRFLPGSQFFMDSIRGANTPELYAHLLNEIEPNLVDIPLKAGEAVFFYHGIVHCSHYNNLNLERVCLGLSLVQKDAPIYFHLLKDGETLPDKYCVTTAFFKEYTHNRGAMPEGLKPIGKDERGFPTLSKAEFEERVSHQKQIA